MIRVSVKLFAVLRDRAGTAEVTLELPDGATVAAAGRALVERLPALHDLTKQAAYAVNREYAGRETVLRDGDEVAVIPPVSGG